MKIKLFLFFLLILYSFSCIASGENSIKKTFVDYKNISQKDVLQGVGLGVVGFLLYFLYNYYQESTQGKHITNFNKTNVSNGYSKLALDYLIEEK